MKMLQFYNASKRGGDEGDLEDTHRERGTSQI